MEERAEFLNRLGGLLTLAKEKGNQITIEEVENYFSDIEFTEEQMELVFDYLLSQKVVVKGYIKVSSSETEEEELQLTEEEEAYLREYMNDLKAFAKVSEAEKNSLYANALQGNQSAKDRLIEIYLKEVVQIAKEMYHKDIFLGDMIQEGNVGLILGVDMLTDVASAHGTITEQIRQGMQMLIEEYTEVHNQGKNMVEKVTRLDESIKALTEEMGRKVSIDELAVYMGMTEEEIEDILRLTGEESEESEEEEEA